MGCGTSSQPQEAASDPGKLAALEGNDENKPQQDDTVLTDKIETFKNSPKQSPSPHEQQVPEVIEIPMNTPAPAYQSHSPTGAQRFTTPVIGNPTSPVEVDSLDPYAQPSAGPSLAPGYIDRNETRKIGGFDPEAFRKANQKEGNLSSPNTNDWATLNTTSNNSSNNGGGGGASNSAWNDNTQGTTGSQRNSQWNQQDYIQSDDIFSTDAPQAYQGNARFDFRDAADPFRAPGGLGHDETARSMNQHNVNKHITNEDDALMDDILGELDEM